MYDASFAVFQEFLPVLHDICQCHWMATIFHFHSLIKCTPNGSCRDYSMPNVYLYVFSCLLNFLRTILIYTW